MNPVVYKVVMRQGDALWSAATRDSNLVVRYVPGAFVEGDFPLFAFSSVYAALSYVFPLQQPFEIWRAEVEGQLDTPMFVASSPRDAMQFWRGVEVPMVPALHGSVICDRLKLVERMSFSA